MPRIHINVQDIEDFDEFEVGWEQLGLAPDQSRDTREGDRRGERRFGGAESLDRKRSERRKQVRRYAKRV